MLVSRAWPPTSSKWRWCASMPVWLKTGLRSRLILQVHDEVILEVPPDEEEAATKVTLEAMQGAALLSVPLEVNVSWGASWADAKG